MKKIFKYNIKATDEQDLILPNNSRILSVEEQNNEIVVYAIVDVDTKEVERFSIIIHGTGHSADDVEDYTFLGTVKMFNGQGMFHVFYK